MDKIDRTLLAEKWHRLYSVNKDQRLFSYRRSFWSGNEIDDLLQKDDSGLASDRVFDTISPGTPDFDWQSIKSPRHYVSLLLGGQENRWANVDFAAAFGTCLTGAPILPHIVKVDRSTPLPDRHKFMKTASILHDGLSAAAMEAGGTAYNVWRNTPTMNYLKSLQGVEVYAKTGTLGEGQNKIRDINRIVLALVRWKNKNQGTIKSGIVLSVVGEDIGVGEAAGWAGDFLVKNQIHIWPEIKN